VSRISFKKNSKSELGSSKLEVDTDKSELIKIDHRTYTPSPVVGVDEVGRGCLAGPVYAGAVCLKSDQLIESLTDSKLISEKRREFLAPLILESHWCGIGFATVEEVDELNILQASLLAMHRAVMALEKNMGAVAGHVLVDGNQRIPDLKVAQTTVIKGDIRCLPISAASIIAKVARDTVMKQLAQEFPAYGFEKHNGYGSEFHRQAIATHGVLALHRKSFRGVKEFVSKGH